MENQQAIHQITPNIIENNNAENKGNEPSSHKKAILMQLYSRLQIIYASKLIQNDSIPNKITENLYIGSLSGANNQVKLKELGITHILTCAAFIKAIFPTVI